MKKRVVKDVDNSLAYNYLPLLPPAITILESNKILKQLVTSSVVLAELKGMEECVFHS